MRLRDPVIPVSPIQSVTPPSSSSTPTSTEAIQTTHSLSDDDDDDDSFHSSRSRPRSSHSGVISATDQYPRPRSPGSRFGESSAIHKRDSSDPDDIDNEGEDVGEGVEEDHKDKETLLASSTRREVTPLPWKKITPLAILLFCEAYNVTQIFPYVAYMVLEFGLISSIDEAGYYAGILASAYSLALAISGPVWGSISDRIGRKKVLLVGSIGNTIFSLGLGFSTNMYTAVACRTLAGIIGGGNSTSAKSMIGELTDSTNQASGFSLFGSMWGLGSLIGPLIGGYLALPAKKYESFDNEFFQTYPFFLPPLISSIFSSIALCMAIMFLDETLDPALRRPMCQRRVVRAETRDIEMVHMDVSEESFHRLDEEEDENESFSHTNASIVDTRRARLLPRLEIELSEPASLKEHSWSSSDKGSISQSTSSFSCRLFSCLIFCGTNRRDEKGREPLELLSDRPAGISIFLYGSIALIFMIWDEGLPLWLASSPKSGGLGFSTSQIGTFQAACGISLLMFQVFFYNRIARRLGKIGSIRIALLLQVCCLLLPLLNSIYDNVVLLWISLSFVAAYRSAIGTMSFISVIILISNSVAPVYRGVLNGISQSVASFVRFLTPLLISPLFAWSITSGWTFPFNQFILFVLIALLSLPTLFVSRYVDSELELPWNERFNTHGESSPSQNTVDTIHASD